QTCALPILPLPLEGTVIVTVNDSDKPTVMPIASRFHELGFRILATEGTQRYLAARGVPAQRVFKVGEGRPNIVDLMISGEVQLLINRSEEHTSELQSRENLVCRLLLEKT